MTQTSGKEKHLSQIIRLCQKRREHQYEQRHTIIEAFQKTMFGLYV